MTDITESWNRTSTIKNSLSPVVTYTKLALELTGHLRLLQLIIVAVLINIASSTFANSRPN